VSENRNTSLVAVINNDDGVLERSELQPDSCQLLYTVRRRENKYCESSGDDRMQNREKLYDNKFRVLFTA